MSELIFKSVTELATLIRTKDVSVHEVVMAHIRQIEAVNPALNAVVCNRFDQARREASLADDKRLAGAALRPLHGVPCTIKDSLDTAGTVTTYGTRGRREFVPQRDATVVRRLRAEGAIVLGKSNTPEFTLGGEMDNPVYGHTNNPHDLSRTPGASSGGAGAIIAAGGSPFDLGSDTGGSIREPANFCGIVGLKPTFGRVPRTGHAVSFGTGAVDFLTQVGPMARTVADLGLLLPIIMGPDGVDPTVVPLGLGDYRAVDMKGLRVAIYIEGGMVAPDAAIGAAVKLAGEALAAQGAIVTWAEPEPLGRAGELHRWVSQAGQMAWLQELLDEAGTVELGENLQRVLVGARAAENPPLDVVLREIGRFQAEMWRFMQDYDLILCPVESTVALPHGYTLQAENRTGWGHMGAYNLTGWPAGSVPVSWTAEGLPVGVQVVGRPWREDVVLGGMGALESWFGAYRRPGI